MIGCLTNPTWKPKLNQQLIADLKKRIADIHHGTHSTRGQSIRLHWVKGHANVPGNVQADSLATAAAAAAHASYIYATARTNKRKAGT